MLSRTLLAVVLITAVAGLAGCHETKGMNKGNVQADDDSAFMREAAEGNLAEVEMGRIALQRAVSTDVKVFGQLMIDDHSIANAQLMQLADAKNIALPSQPNLNQRMMADRLQGRTGADFDQAYMCAMIDDHQKDIKAYENEVNKGTDPDVVAYACNTLPTLREHLALAQQVAASVGVMTK